MPSPHDDSGGWRELCDQIERIPANDLSEAERRALQQAFTFLRTLFEAVDQSPWGPARAAELFPVSRLLVDRLRRPSGVHFVEPEGDARKNLLTFLMLLQGVARPAAQFHRRAILYVTTSQRAADDAEKDLAEFGGVAGAVNLTITTWAHVPGDVLKNGIVLERVFKLRE